MPELLVCRACLANNVPVYDILHTRYQHAMERITSVSFAEAGKPHALCAPCLEILDKCCKLQEKSKVTEGLLTRLLQRNQLTEDAIKSIDRLQHKLADYLPSFPQLVPMRASQQVEMENIMVKIEPFDTQTRDLTEFPEQAKTDPTAPIEPPNSISIETVRVKETPFIQIDTGKLLNVKTEVDDVEEETSNTRDTFDDSLIQIDVEMEHTKDNDVSADNKNILKEHIEKLRASSDAQVVNKSKNIDSKTEIEAYLKKYNIDNRRLKTISCSKKCEIKCEHKPRAKPSIKQTEESYPCTDCDYKTYSKKNLIYHMKRHTNQLVICAICGYKCATKSRLVSHIRIHTKERPYQCNVCGKHFTEVGTLSKHFNNLHKGIKAFKCMWCDYGAATKSHLDRHIQRHTGDKRFKCELCDYACVQKWDLKRHLKIHENGDRAIRYKRVAPVIVRIVSMAEKNE